MRRAGELIMQVKMMLVKETDPIRQLELIDELQRLGLSDHFQKEFKEILNSIYLDNKIHEMKEESDLYSTALAFRLLREHGFHVAQGTLLVIITILCFTHLFWFEPFLIYKKKHFALQRCWSVSRTRRVSSRRTLRTTPEDCCSSMKPLSC